MGADGIGKQELEKKLVQRADFLVADSAQQCCEFGELSHAICDGKLFIFVVILYHYLNG